VTSGFAAFPLPNPSPQGGGAYVRRPLDAPKPLAIGDHLPMGELQRSQCGTMWLEGAADYPSPLWGGWPEGSGGVFLPRMKASGHAAFQH
jgi:hypothetical protein